MIFGANDTQKYERQQASQERKFYMHLVDVREREIKLPEEQKTLKTSTFLAIEKDIRNRKLPKDGL
jgi:hypothetical protein